MPEHQGPKVIAMHSMSGGWVGKAAAPPDPREREKQEHERCRLCGKPHGEPSYAVAVRNVGRYTLELCAPCAKLLDETLQELLNGLLRVNGQNLLKGEDTLW